MPPSPVLKNLSSSENGAMAAASVSGLAVASAATQGPSAGSSGGSGGGFMKFVKDCGTCKLDCMR